jgi:hypothetical protein
MKKLRRVGLIAALTLAPVLARADDEGTTAEALARTQQLLTDSQMREALLQADPKAPSADENARAAARSDADLEAIYALSAELMSSLIDASGGDPDKMAKMLDEANSNPEKFAATLAPEQRKKLAAFAKQIESANAQKP